jgi:hypothetical protein
VVTEERLPTRYLLFVDPGGVVDLDTRVPEQVVWLAAREEAARERARVLTVGNALLADVVTERITHQAETVEVLIGQLELEQATVLE